MVLGNGFDLECGLPTRFCHFFEPRIEALKSQDWKVAGRLEGLGYEATPTLWDFLLRSKMYRVITAGTDFGEGAVHAAGGRLLSHETRVVKFYGHSLGEADYAYFQAIFDSVNLYASDTKLVFYYKPHLKPGDDGADALLSDKRAKNTMAARVTRLLAEYGKTLDNEDHGRNLMHKLMIEGRLEVRLLKNE